MKTIICNIIICSLLLLCNCNPYAPIGNGKQDCALFISLAAIVFTDPIYNNGTTEQERAAEEEFKKIAILAAILSCNPDIGDNLGGFPKPGEY